MSESCVAIGYPRGENQNESFVTVAGFTGVTSITIDDKTGKLTVVGDIDVPIIVMKLRKLCKTEIISVDAVKPPEKKPEPEKPAPPKPSEKIASPVPMNLAERVQSCLCLFF
ncbi:unnamed protein product [Arabidopsis thaliana]|uniref:Copper transport protein family n=1 Tax=Arabidopsis thaliana TaxID=3702 RepID=Q9LTE0_ARATH|nr:Copper transport protein family [Arabidopsis thaliana]AAY78863.1 heavy-metal-associated protein-related [Arabidopsis thaliana]AED96258.1 Copper transport protein family [Arabidopsis thaliana]BAA98095.1 unnamed protein product [Arabidopsis thaliana]|eukprot:NP_200089.1 Copper transport protein family [Arabidopsis thaliana]